MIRISIFILLLLIASPVVGQVPMSIGLQILKAEDARDYPPALQNLMYHSDPAVRKRAALAAGRIGNDAAADTLAKLLETDTSLEVRAMAAFALGEIESAKGADAILRTLNSAATSDAVRSSAVEAAGKIAAANAKDPKAKALGDAILQALDGKIRERDTVLLAITAALRARPDGTDKAVAAFLTSPDARIRADAANTLARVRAQNANETLRKLLGADRDPIARANAARALGAAEDQGAFDPLLAAAIEDSDGRVRVSAIRSLAQLKDKRAAGKLLDRGELLLAQYKEQKKPNYIPSVHSEFIEIATTLGRLLSNTYDQRAVSLFREFGKLDKGFTAEVYLARLRIAPGKGDDTKPGELTHWRQYSTLAQIVGEFAVLEPTTDEAKKIKAEAPEILRPLAMAFAEADPKAEAATIKAAPDVLQAYARFKTADLAEILRTALKNKDVYIRATAAGLIADLPASAENTEALRAAFSASLLSDKIENDAQLALLDALYKLDKKEVGGLAASAVLKAPDYLVRKRAFDILKDEAVRKDLFPVAHADQVMAAVHAMNTVQPYQRKTGTLLGQVLNTNADYRRALSRKNGSVKAILTTQKGTFTIDLLPEDAPLTVDNFVKLARSRYFDGLEVHRVVPNFVMQDGDPRGDGNGGPGWSIRCEINMVRYERGAVGMALSGKDTGGSQWFVTHSPQPHLDGGYTVLGRVNETDMKVVDSIVKGDKILTVRIIGR
jgi:cyclophilin family peptidyl-prolyl cis-trans isomerase/HEAT repeat protein